MHTRTTELIERLRLDLRVAGLSERTQYCYTQAVRRLADHYQRSPDEVSISDIYSYLVQMRMKEGLSSASVKIAFHGIRSFRRYTLGSDIASLPYMRFRTERKLPDVLSIEEVRQIIDAEPALHHRAFFWTAYSLGLRLSEVLHLKPAHIDRNRRVVHVHHGKGGADRYVPLPQRTLDLLRAYASTHGNSTWFFPAWPGKPDRAAAATLPMNRSTVQAAIRLGARRAGLRKRVSIHTLRHSYATHLLEAGVSIRLIQQYLGHATLSSTIRYLHLTTRGHELAVEAIERLMS